MTELLSDPKHIRGDLAIIRTAIRRGYEIPDELLLVLPKIAGALVLDKTEKGQVRLKAIQTIMAMKESNDRAENPQPVPQTTVNVGVKIDNANLGVGRTLAAQIVERIRAARISGNSAG